jgi:hypothetical protein
MNYVACDGAVISERPERTAQGYRRLRCRDCGRQFNERSCGLLNRTVLSRLAPFAKGRVVRILIMLSA